MIGEDQKLQADPRSRGRHFVGAAPAVRSIGVDVQKAGHGAVRRRIERVGQKKRSWRNREEDENSDGGHEGRRQQCEVLHVFFTCSSTGGGVTGSLQARR